MARIRSVHPGLWTDEDFVALTPFARLLYIALWNECDDHGVFDHNPRKLKIRLLPMDAVDVDALLDELDTFGMITRFSCNERDYGAVRNFRRYQRPESPKHWHPFPAEIDAWVGSRETGHPGSAKAPPPAAKPQAKGRFRPLSPMDRRTLAERSANSPEGSANSPEGSAKPPEGSANAPGGAADASEGSAATPQGAAKAPKRAPATAKRPQKAVLPPPAAAEASLTGPDSGEPPAPSGKPAEKPADSTEIAEGSANGRRTVAEHLPKTGAEGEERNGNMEGRREDGDGDSAVSPVGDTVAVSTIVDTGAPSAPAPAARIDVGSGANGSLPAPTTQEPQAAPGSRPSRVRMAKPEISAPLGRRQQLIPEPVDLVWTEGLAIYRSMRPGLEEDKARAMIGKVMQLSEDDAQGVLNALRKLQRAGPCPQPESYLIVEVMRQCAHPDHEALAKTGLPAELYPSGWSSAWDWRFYADSYGIDETGVIRPQVNGIFIDLCAREVTEAVRWQNGQPADWSMLRDWLHYGYDFDQQIMPAIRKVMQHIRAPNEPVRGLKMFAYAMKLLKPMRQASRQLGPYRWHSAEVRATRGIEPPWGGVPGEDPLNPPQISFAGHPEPVPGAKPQKSGGATGRQRSGTPAASSAARNPSALSTTR
jgi:hypothetical protein